MSAELQNDVLWCAYVRGPDDLVPTPDYESAVALCDWFTAVDRGNIADDLCPLFAAIPMVWTYGAERHADAMAQRAIKGADYPIDMNLPQGSISRLTEIARKHPLCKIGLEAETKARVAVDTDIKEAAHAALYAMRQLDEESALSASIEEPIRVALARSYSCLEAALLGKPKPQFNTEAR